MTKKCTKCNTIKNITDFHKSSRSKDKLQVYCKVCNNSQRREYYKQNPTRNRAYGKQRGENNMKKLYNWFLSHPCVDCGESDPIVLEADHTRDKLFTISTEIRNYGWDRIEKELDKCVSRCANCHRRKTAKQFNWYKYITV